MQSLNSSESALRSSTDSRPRMCGDLRVRPLSKFSQREKKLPLHIVAQIDHDLQINDPPETTVQDSYSALHSKHVGAASSNLLPTNQTIKEQNSETASLFEEFNLKIHDDPAMEWHVDMPNL